MKDKIKRITINLPVIPGVKQVCQRVEAGLPFLPKLSEFVPCKRT